MQYWHDTIGNIVIILSADFDAKKSSINKYCFYLISRINISEAVVVKMYTDTFEYHYDTTRVSFQWKVLGGEPDMLELQYRYIIIFTCFWGNEFSVEIDPNTLDKDCLAMRLEDCLLGLFFFIKSKNMCSWLVLSSKQADTCGPKSALLKNSTVHSIMNMLKIYNANSGFVTRWHYMPSFSGKKIRMIE